MSDLPQTWTDCRLGDVVDYGITRKREPEEISGDSWVLELEDIEKGTSRLLDRQNFAQRQSKSTKNGFDAGDVLYGKLRPYLNKVLIADHPGYCTTEIVPLKAGPHLDARYLFYWLKHPTFLAYVEAESHGLNMPRLGTDAGRAAPFVFAPRPEQTRIADKLDAVLKRVDACRNRLDRIPVILKRFRQSVLSAAASGVLTEDWRDGNKRTLTEWNNTTVGDIATVVRGASPRPAGDPRYFGGYCPWITVGELTKDETKYLTATSSFVTAEGRERSRYIEAGTLLLTNSGATLGVPKITLIGGCINDGSVALLDVEEPNKSFLYWKLKGLTQHLRGLNQGAAQPNLNTGIVKAISVELPSVEEQTEIVRRVEILFAFADQLEARYAVAHAQVEKLTPSLLAKAFRGELVPQDPNDEPASVLLERIAAERATTEVQPRRRQATTGRKPTRAAKEKIAVTKSRQDEDVQGRPYLAQHLRLLGGSASAEALFKVSELPVADFYKQLAWEVAKGHVRDGKTVLELTDAA